MLESKKPELITGGSLAVQWLGLRASTAEGTGSILGWETKILYAVQHGQNKKNNNNKEQK